MAELKEIDVRPVSEEEFVSRVSRPRLGTGYPELDRALGGGFSPDLYVLGSETSTGKSALLMSMAQHIAEAGTDVLYFALDMSRDEFFARGISAISLEHWIKSKDAEGPVPKRYTAGDVLYWQWDPEAGDFRKIPYADYAPYADEYFRRYGGHLYIVENRLDCDTILASWTGWTARDICGAVQMWMQEKQKPVIVFVDYLQEIRPDPKSPAQLEDRKTRVDVAVTALKSLSARNNIPVVVASSVSRAQYGRGVSSRSCKESGDVEYTAGVLLGWDWIGVTDEWDEKRQEDARQRSKERGVRMMRFSVLKSRNNVAGDPVEVAYVPAYNSFFTESQWFGSPMAYKWAQEHPSPYMVIRGDFFDMWRGKPVNVIKF